MFQTAGIAFIVLAFGGAIYLAQRPTIATGEGLAATVHGLKAYKDRDDVAITCDDGVPITADGARFHCTARSGSGEQLLACTIYRTGSIACPTFGD